MSRLPVLSLAQRMVLIPVVAGVGFLAVLAGTLTFDDWSSRQMELIRDGFEPSLEMDIVLQTELSDLHRSLREAVRVGDTDQLDMADSIAGVITARLAGAAANPVVDAASLEDLQDRFQKYYLHARAVGGGLLAGEAWQGQLRDLQVMDTNFASLRATLQTRAEVDRRRMTSAFLAERAGRRVRTLLITVALVVLVGVLASLVAATTYGLRRGLRHVQETASAIAEGDLAIDTRFSTYPDIRVLAGPLLAVTDYIRDIAHAADRLAHGDLAVEIRPRSERDVVLANLRHAIEDRREVENALQESEEQLRQAAKMEAVGQLAGGIAHDFNNLLTVIQGRLALLSDALGPDGVGEEDLSEIGRSADRAAALTRQLLAYSRKQVLHPRFVDLNEVVADVVRMTRPIIGEDIIIETHLDPDLWSVRVDTGQIEQVLVNLLVNARDAMPDGGHVTLHTSNVELDDDYAQRRPLTRPGPYALVVVSDDGAGMPKDVCERIFEPFFTTKEAGRGTGLGLSTAYGIVKQSGGDIQVRSEEGQGTTFEIYLPHVAAAAQETDWERPAAPPAEAEADGTILLAEDSRPVRALIWRILTTAGYRVIEAADGNDAIAAAERYPYTIDLLLTDVVMPGRSGPDVARELRRLRPGLPVLFMSGYADDGERTDGRIDLEHPLIEKPFNPADLVAQVQAALGGTGSRA